VGAIKKGGHVVIKGFPCKVAEYSTAKTGKHGSAKANIMGYDIFSGKKYEMFAPTSATAQEPNGASAARILRPSARRVETACGLLPTA
jgi:translation initiation factor 5A